MKTYFWTAKVDICRVKKRCKIGTKDTIEDFYELQRKQQRGQEGRKAAICIPSKEKGFSSSNLKINSLAMIKLRPIWKRFFLQLPYLFSLSLNLHCSIFAIVPLFFFIRSNECQQNCSTISFQRKLGCFVTKKLFLNLWNALSFEQEQRSCEPSFKKECFLTYKDRKREHTNTPFPLSCLYNRNN